MKVMELSAVFQPKQRAEKGSREDGNQSKAGPNPNLGPIRRQNRPLFEVPSSETNALANLIDNPTITSRAETMQRQVRLRRWPPQLARFVRRTRNRRKTTEGKLNRRSGASANLSSARPPRPRRQKKPTVQGKATFDKLTPG
jgi:hypothetical protein